MGLNNAGTFIGGAGQGDPESIENKPLRQMNDFRRNISLSGASNIIGDFLGKPHDLLLIER
jgi:hypothetical protein